MSEHDEGKEEEEEEQEEGVIERFVAEKEK